jgi:hypothetical protein
MKRLVVQPPIFLFLAAVGVGKSDALLAAGLTAIFLFRLPSYR